MGKHWLYEWIDEFEVKTSDQIADLLKFPGPVDRLHKMASDAPNLGEGDEPPGKSIVAGSTMDFSGRLNCCEATCLSKQVDRLFGRVWHYFDSVVVQGPSAGLYVATIENRARQSRFDLTWRVGQDVEFLLHLRDLRVTEHLSFVPKEELCAAHVEEYGRSSDYSYLFDPALREELAKQLKREATFGIYLDDNEWCYNVAHPACPDPFTGGFGSRQKHGSKKKKPTKRQVSDRIIDRSVSALVFDLATSEQLELPLAAELSHLNLPGLSNSGESRVAQVALNLPMPVMHGMNSRDIILLRGDLKPHFDRFQFALTAAIREQLGRDPERSDAKVAKAIQEEFIRPAFADIERALLESKKSFSVKFGASLAVGTTVASVGLLTSVPLVVGAGVATALGTTLSGAHKKRDERRDVKTSDVYFLWEAQQNFRIPPKRS